MFQTSPQPSSFRTPHEDRTYVSRLAKKAARLIHRKHLPVPSGTPQKTLLETARSLNHQQSGRVKKTEA
ncbi:unnamed protein product [Peniophora sp. CBMAI 1063]|nr:unnamed protein product [Peniophora sp. CBMAI 1063]